MKKTTKPSKKPEMYDDAKIIERVANTANRSEKTSWQRKQRNMDDLLKQIRPIEDKILSMQAQLQPIYDAVAMLRTVMVNECIHPQDYLVIKEGFVECKFCNKRMTIPSMPVIVKVDEQ